jgi:UDP-glucose 4-epimerase
MTKAVKKVLVLGGSGFLGSHVADALTDAGYQVRIFDLVPSPYLREGQEMVTGDILDLDQVVCATMDCAYVYNFAGIADIDAAHRNPVETAKLNVLGAVNTLEAARLAKVVRYVFASSIYVYSNKGSFYRASKQSAERFIETYQECFGLNHTILRYGSLYGRRSDGRNNIHRLLIQALSEKKLTYPGNGEELREYIHVADAAKASVAILDDEYANQHIIVTGNEKMRVRDLLLMISEILGGSVKLEFSKKEIEGHYTITPYAFNPKIGRKLVNTYHIDMGQGLLDCLAEIHQLQVKGYHAETDLLVKDKNNI